MPDNLDFAEEPRQESFQSEGGHFRHFEKYYGFSLIVPPLAVPEGREINVKVGLCCYGPFSISDKYLLASDFAVIVADGQFSKPVKVLMEHCLILPEYKKCSEIVILRADHRKVTKDGLYTFDKFTIPEIDSDSPRLSFESTEFCILCAVLEKCGHQPESTIPPQKQSEESTTEGGSVEKKYSTIEYAALLLQPTEILKVNDLYRFMIFICTNCPVAYKVSW